MISLKTSADAGAGSLDPLARGFLAQPWALASLALFVAVDGDIDQQTGIFTNNGDQPFPKAGYLVVDIEAAGRLVHRSGCVC